MLKPIRMEAGLGNPPREYTNNDPESANFVIKHGLNFDEKKPHEFVQEMKNIIERQYRDEDRAVFGKGPYEVRPEFQHLIVDDKTWSKMSHEQLMAKVEKYVKSGMDAKKVVVNKEVEIDNISSQDSLAATITLPITASDSGITTVPMPILQAMFEKANQLLRKRDNVIPKPGATDGSFIVAGNSNTIHVVTLGKGGCLKCDRNCVNNSTRICEHVLAVAQVREKLSEFLAWYRRSKKGPKVLEMALGSAPKNAGRKPSTRKKSNKKKPTVTQVVDLLEDLIAEPVATPNQIPPAAPQTSQAPHRVGPVFQPPSVVSGSGGPQAPQFNPTIQLPMACGLPQTPPQHLAYHLPLLFSGCPHDHAPQQYLAPQVPAISPQNHSAFRLKWVMGTSVTRCYGCGGEIQNPPQTVPDDLIVVYRDIREYRDRDTGQLQYTRGPVNLHFHLRSACIRIRYPHFTGNALVISQDFSRYFRSGHIERLANDFGLNR